LQPAPPPPPAAPPPPQEVRARAPEAPQPPLQKKADPFADLDALEAEMSRLLGRDA